MKRPSSGAPASAFAPANVFRLFARAALGCALAGLAACPSAPVYEEPAPPAIVERGPPEWIKEPLSWRKLEMIEQWLDREGASHSAELRIEAELTLNEGRVHFSQQDLDRESVSRDTLKLRVENAKKGFEGVLADSAANAGARIRAQNGVRRAQVLLSAPGAKEVAIVRRAQWGARAARPGNLTPLKGQWSRITVHHSAETSSDPDGGSLEDSAATLRAIQKYHMDDAGHGWGDIGYHFVIDSGGRIFEARELEWQGAHAGGSHNQQNLGICLLGNFLKRSPTDAALKSLQLLLTQLRTKYRIPADRVEPHLFYGNTQCPGPALTAWLKKQK